MIIESISAELNFDTLQEIGQEGKNSKVYLSHDKQLDAEIVIKRIEKTKLATASLFFAEAKKLYDSAHPNVVQIKYACQDADHIYLAMPFYKNGSLKQLINQRPLKVREILKYSIQFLTGLNHIHVQKLIHFDIKPDNIFISDSNEALVADFGLAKNMNNFGMSQQDQVYNFQAPPDVFLQTEHSNLFDIYMAAITIYRLCNGNGQFYAQTQKYTTADAFKNAILAGEFPDRKAYLPHIPKKLSDTINKAIRADQTQRPQTIIELINDLSAVDKLLDWVFVPNDRWILELDDKIIEVRITVSGQLAEVTTTKTMKQSGVTQRISAGCQKNVNLDKLTKTVRDILMEQDQ